MITLYIRGSAEIVNGISVDYIIVSATEVEALLNVGWVKDPSLLV